MLKEFCEALNETEVWLILDTETTGLHDGEICQIAIMNSNGKVLLDTLVKTVQPIPQDATKIHGITDDMVKDAPMWKEIADEVQSILAGELVVIYNAVYDRKMMHKSDERSGLPHYDYKHYSEFMCAMEAYAEFYGDWNDYHQSYRWQTLRNAALNLNIPLATSHNALADCMTTMSVVKRMLKHFNTYADENGLPE